MHNLRYQPGQAVFTLPIFAQSLQDKRIEGRVKHGFLGADNEEHYVLELKDSTENVSYIVRSYSALADTQEGPSNFDKRIKTDKAFATKFLMKAGILNENGQLAEVFKS